MTAPIDIDQLIEEGLTLYGQGDLDGALLAWEHALAVDPENAQANSYVDYVRQNYDLLTGDATNDEQRVPFGLDDDPYQIEILPGELIEIPADSPMVARTMSELDAGWFMDDENSEPRRTFEIEADETPATSFEDQTREYGKAPSGPTVSDARAEFADVDLTPGLDTTSGFASQVTGVRERDTGFVRPSSSAEPRSKRPSQVPAEIQMTLRTPTDTSDPYSAMELPTDDAPPASASISLSYDDPPTTERPISAAAVDLINSLPSPTPNALASSSGSSPARTDTAELPNPLRPPAPAPDGPILSATTTQDFESQKTNAQLAKPASAEQAPTRELPTNKIPTFAREMVSAPTRDLGLRSAGIVTLPDEDARTRKDIQPAPPAVGDGTRMDVILPFDPIDARAAQILDEVDEGAPDREPREDRTRRRITVLFERAVTWSSSGELDKAVAAIDLALSEDPGSALGQKLVHRHRDTMMSVFQAFLGDLDRQPLLARPLHELANAPISPRAAFLLSRIDGSLSLDELLDVSGMPRIEAYRYLCQLFLRGILR